MKGQKKSFSYSSGDTGRHKTVFGFGVGVNFQKGKREAEPGAPNYGSQGDWKKKVKKNQLGNSAAKKNEHTS